MRTLDDGVHHGIVQLCSVGDQLLDRGSNRAAIESYRLAWDLLPEPKEEWEAATWILSAIGDAAFLSSSFEEAHVAFSRAVECPQELGNAFIHLRLGQCCFELNSPGKAADELARAYMAGGVEVFEGEDPRYLAYLRTQLLAPPGGELW